MPPLGLAQILRSLEEGALAGLLAGVPPLAAERFREAVTAGLAAGRGPEAIARSAIQAVDGLPKVRALTIARTEMMNAYRQGSLEVYRERRLGLEGWMWIAAMERTTCAYCIAQHGTIHSLDEEMDAHPNCRCSMAPVARKGLGVEPPGITPGPEQFAKWPEADQRAVLGPGKLKAYKAGKPLDEIVMPKPAPLVAERVAAPRVKAPRTPTTWRTAKGEWKWKARPRAPDFDDLAPMPDSHFTRIRGVRVIVEDGLDRKAHADGVEKMLTGWPDDALAKLREVRLRGDFLDDTIYGGRVRATGGGGRVTFYGQRAYEIRGPLLNTDVFDHEMGHVLGTRSGMVGDVPKAAKGWTAAKKADAAESADYLKIRGIEWDYMRPITPGKFDVTEYGSTMSREDWAESIGLWKLDQRTGQIGEFRETGQAVRFADVFPNRARVIDAFMSTLGA